jgi:hypothetical protein
MSTPTLNDPVLGTLSYRRDWYEWSEWVGQVEFRPGQPIEVVFNEWRYSKDTCADQLARARATYRKLSEGEGRESTEAFLREEVVSTLVAEGKWPGIGPDDELEEDQWAALEAQLRLIGVDLYDDGSGGLNYIGPEAVTKGGVIHCGTKGYDCTSVLLNEPKKKKKKKGGVVAALQATALFKEVAKTYPAVVEVWPDPSPQGDGCEYAWIMAVQKSKKGTEATNLAYFRLQGDSLQIKIHNRHGEVRWLDLSGFSASELMKHVAPR